MPPRFAYWTILIDNRPTAFRARDREELLPTLRQLQRTNPDVVLKWFARGRIWGSRDEEQAFWRKRHLAADQRRDKNWRPGGQHADPRARFGKPKRRGSSNHGKPPKRNTPPDRD